jgi:hypothetical protein
MIKNRSTVKHQLHCGWLDPVGALSEVCAGERCCSLNCWPSSQAIIRAKPPVSNKKINHDGPELTCPLTRPELIHPVLIIVLVPLFNHTINFTKAFIHLEQ